MGVEKETEEKIFEAARIVFQRNGFDGARMQEIADEAAINKSMLHYYYRNKDNLFFEVFKAGAEKIIPAVFEILGSEISLKEKVTEIVKFYHHTFRENPQLPSFVIFEMNHNPERFHAFMQAKGFSIPEEFIRQVEQEVQEGKIIPIKPKHFLLNVISMCMMPMIARNMVKNLFSMDDFAYQEFIDERQEMIPDLIFKGVSFFSGGAS